MFPGMACAVPSSRAGYGATGQVTEVAIIALSNPSRELPLFSSLLPSTFFFLFFFKRTFSQRGLHDSALLI